MKLNQAGYIVPDPIDPNELICFRVYVPKDTIYIGAFWQAYQFFTSWLAWVKDPLHRGKQAAAVWRVAYDKARAEFDITKGRCEMNVTGVRTDPNNKCKLQVEFDGNNVWVDVADMSDCGGCGGGGGAMIYDGVNVSIYNDCSEEFEPSGEPFNPSTHGIYDSLYSEGASGQCNGAANMAAFVHKVSQDGIERYAALSLVGEVASVILGAFVGLAGANVLWGTLLTFLSVWHDEWGDFLEDAAEIDITEAVKNIIYQYTSSDGTITPQDFTNLTVALADMIETGVDDPTKARWAWETGIVTIAGPYLLSHQNKYAGITDADCTGSGWTHTFDFTTGKHGWVEDDETAGVYVTGQGWRTAVFVDPFGNTYRSAGIKIALPTRTLTNIKCYSDNTLGVNDVLDAVERRLTSFYKNDHTTGFEASVETQPGEVVETWTGSESGVITVLIAVTVGHDSNPPQTDPGGQTTITKVVLSGDGTDPF